MYQELYNFAIPLKSRRPSLFLSVKYFLRDKSTYEVYLEMIQEQKKIPLRITQKTREKKKLMQFFIRFYARLSERFH